MISIVKNNCNNQWLIAKYPSEEFLCGSQLIVDCGQEALFYKDDKLFDRLKHGEYILSQTDLPLISKALNGFLKDNSYFSANLYFINKNVKMNWGTKEPISVEESGNDCVLHICANGKYEGFVIDSELFVSKMGSYCSKDTPWSINQHLSKKITEIIESVLNKYTISQEVYFNNIRDILLSLTEKIKEELKFYFKKMGIELTSFDWNSITPKKESKTVIVKGNNNVIGNNNVVGNNNVIGDNNVVGDNNISTNKTDDLLKAIKEIKDSINDNNLISSEDKEYAFETLNDISEKVNQNKKPTIIKSLLIGLKDFVLSIGAQVTADLITYKIQGLF